MKKIFIVIAMGVGCLWNHAEAQDLSSLINGAVGTLNNAASSSDNSTVSSAAGTIGNILASVTGSVTTTQANLIGTWTYTSPAVQFESENLLSQAGGSTVATRVENKLASMYKMVGISEGKLVFTFAQDGTVNYSLGGKSFTGTYVFDNTAKTVTITTSFKITAKAYVTISGNQMSLCFDSSKVLSLFSSVSSQFNSSISSLAGSYEGMKTGFKFTK